MKTKYFLLFILSLSIFAGVHVGCGNNRHSSYGDLKGRTKIAFTSDGDGNDEIYVMNTDGSDQTNLTNSPTTDWYPDWSPDGKRIIFSSDRDTSHTEGDEDIWVMKANGTDVKRLTNTPSGWSGFAAWSPDGSKIAFCSDPDGTQGGIYIMNADGSGITRVTNDPEPGLFPDWSPDGSRIVYMRAYEDNCEIYIIDVNGTNKTNLTNNPDIDGYPSWSPDGTKIAFNHEFFRGEKAVCNICVMDPDGTNLVQLTKQSTIHEPSGGGVPRWSPDGKKIVFQAGGERGAGIYTMNADGTNRVFLTAGIYAAWSPFLNENK